MPSTSQLEHAFAGSWPPEMWSDVPIVAAVSGGADSVALLRLLAAVHRGREGSLLVAHFNHRLRGAESSGDAEFVRCLADRLKLPFLVGQADSPSAETDCPPQLREEHCRQERYRFLSHAAAKSGARYLVTAHTADDQAETILHRVIRGTGLRGLAGIPRVRPLNPATTIIRPLLNITRAEILDYLAALGQEYRDDSTNNLLHATRNRIRHDLLPHLAEQYNPQVKKALLSLGQLAGEAQSLIDELVDDLLTGIVVAEHEGDFEIHCGGLAAQPRCLVRECLVRLWRQRGWPEQAMGFDEWQSMTDLATSPATAAQPAQIYPGAIRALRKENRLRLDRQATRS